MREGSNRVRKVACFSISLNLELLFCEIFDSKKLLFFILSEYHLHSYLRKQTQFAASTAFEGVKNCAHRVKH